MKIDTVKINESGGNSLNSGLSYYFRKSYTPQSVFIFAFIFLCLNTATSFIFSLIGYGYPHNTFLFDPGDRFADFFKFIDAFHIARAWDNNGINPYTLHNRIFGIPFYTALSFIHAKLILYTGNKYIVLVLWYSIFLATIIFVLRKTGNSFLTIALSILSYPMLFELDRGNPAIIVYVFLLIALLTDNIIIATLAIAIVTSVKFTPAVFILPLLMKQPFSIIRGLKVLGWFLFWMVIITYGSILIIEKAYLHSRIDHYYYFIKLLNDYDKSAVIKLVGLGYGSSIYPPLVCIARKLNIVNQFIQYVKPLFVPVIIFGLIGIVLLLKGTFVAKLKEAFTSRKLVFLICISFVLFMPATCDYYLLILLIPLLIYPSVSYSFGYLLVYGLLIASKNFMFVGNIGGHWVSWQVFINPLLLLLMLFAEFDLVKFMKRSEGKEINKSISHGK